jgi:MoxR-like ATPase
VSQNPETDLATTVSAFSRQVTSNIEKVIVGKVDAIKLLLIGLLSRGHLLIEDVPGVGKTMLARSLARSVGCSFRRVQFTPDMLPSDLTGVYVFNQATREFEFRPGPLMTQIVLTDEINRATPKTQAALLEAMGEGQITVDGVTHTLPTPFMVLATQNPIEYEGTFPLPEGQLDRFLMRIRLGYADPEDEIRILDDQQYQHPLESLDQAATVEQLIEAQELLKTVHVSAPVKKYIVAIVGAVRQHPDVIVGPSPRASLSLFRTAQARAAIEAREYVLPDDIKALLESVVAHRFILSPESRMKKQSRSEILQSTLRSIPVPISEG